MPYITAQGRFDLKELAFKRGSLRGCTAGELNYIITTALLAFQDCELSYERINAALGALEGAKLEFYRRVAAPYENAKLAQNGDVYT
jgi:hypothetical protein